MSAKCCPTNGCFFLESGERGPHTIWERHFELEQAALPNRLLFAWDAAIPFLEVHYALRVAHGLCEEAERVVASPLLPDAHVRVTVYVDWHAFAAGKNLPFFGEAVDAEAGHDFA